VNTTIAEIGKEIPMVANPLPDLGRCGMCDEEIRRKKCGALYYHERPFDPEGPLYIDAAGLVVTRCPGAGKAPAEVLEPTFARWLWSHRSRRDVRTSAVTLLCEFVCGLSRGCASQSRFADLAWS
jgi:hypothetical protein